MKKFARVLALMLVATMLCVLFASCGATPNSDPAEAAKALEEAGYTVNKNEVPGVLTTVTATNLETGDVVTIQYYADEATAEAAYKVVEEQAKAAEELASELGEDADIAYGIDGTMVWVGTPDAVSAAA